MSANLKILQTGVEILAESGLAAVTVSDVAKRAGFSRQTVHVNFRNVEGLRAEVIKEARRVGNQRAIQWLDLAGL